MKSRTLSFASASFAVASLALMVMAGCAVGPDYQGPPAMNTPNNFVRAAAAPVSGEAPDARWWMQLNDQKLDELIDKALKASPSIDVATARLREARSALSQERAKELPNTGASGAFARAHGLTSAIGASSSNGSNDTDIYVIGFDATWEVDLFGAHRRAVEGAAASLDASRASLRDVYVTLSSEVAKAYIQLRDAQQRAQLTERNIEIERQLLDLAKRRRTAGTASDLDVARLANQVDTTQATLGPLQAKVVDQLDRLALLTGGTPGTLDQELTEAAAVPVPPESVPIGDAAGMIRRRPDIASAERKLAQQTAIIGQDMAALFPKLTLLGDVGFASPRPSGLFEASSFTWVAAPLLQWSPFDFGRNKAKIQMARDSRDEAEADYRRTVLAALQDAESSLNRYGRQRNTVGDYSNARASAERVYALTEVRMRNGVASTTDLLDADSRRVQAQLNYQQAVTEMSTDFVAMQKSLGLGWF